MKKGRAKMQAFGGFLTAMVIPNMGAFIVWGFITALFIPSGWIPNENFNELVSPILMYMLPLLLAYTGGTLVYGQRGAMIMGPLSAWIIKKFDHLLKDKIPAGFDMVVNNFSLGIIGFIVCLCSFSFIGPLILQANKFVSFLIQQLVKTGFLPILSLINEPAKVLFLNNVIDQGIYYPLGMQQSLEAGKSIYFMVASNPGAGLGLLLAYSWFGKGDSKRTAPGAAIIHFLGGIHEIYFPYVLMKPSLILAMILGNGAGTLIFSLLGVGLVAGPSPGSIIAYFMLTPKGNFIGMILGVIVAAAVSFAVSGLILKTSRATSDEELEKSMERSKAMKQEGKNVLNAGLSGEKTETKTARRIENIAFACDAGMGSSAMGANAFCKKLQKAGIELTVHYYAIERIPAEVQVIVTHENLAERAKIANPNKRIITIKNYMSDVNIEALYQEIVAQEK